MVKFYVPTWSIFTGVITCIPWLNDGYDFGEPLVVKVTIAYYLSVESYDVLHGIIDLYMLAKFLLISQKLKGSQWKVTLIHYIHMQR